MKMTKEEIILARIKTLYGNVAKFSSETGFPEYAIRNMKARGLSGMSVSTAIKLCRILGLDLDQLMDDKFSIRPNAQKEIAFGQYVASINQDKYAQIQTLLLQLSPAELDLIIAQLQGIQMAREETNQTPEDE